MFVFHRLPSALCGGGVTSLSELPCSTIYLNTAPRKWLSLDGRKRLEGCEPLWRKSINFLFESETGMASIINLPCNSLTFPFDHPGLLQWERRQDLIIPLCGYKKLFSRHLGCRPGEGILPNLSPKAIFSLFLSSSYFHLSHSKKFVNFTTQNIGFWEVFQLNVFISHSVDNLLLKEVT